MNLVTVQGRGNVYKLARDHNNIIIIIVAVKLDWGAWAKLLLYIFFISPLRLHLGIVSQTTSLQ